MELIKEFSTKFNSNIKLRYDLIIRKNDKFFLIEHKKTKLIKKNFSYVGLYLGQKTQDKFNPSFCLLKIILEKSTNKIFVNKKAEWLFVCGRDIFKKGITKIIGSKKEGDYTLILNLHGECLGYGKIFQDLDKKQRGVVIENIKDIGDFLRRERNIIKDNTRKNK